jgi:hypothetical protein
MEAFSMQDLSFIYYLLFKIFCDISLISFILASQEDSSGSKSLA